MFSTYFLKSCWNKFQLKLTGVFFYIYVIQFHVKIQAENLKTSATAVFLNYLRG